MNRRILFLVPTFVLVGCAASIEGVWALKLPVNTDGDACDEKLSHNFTDVEENTADTGSSDWTEDISYDGSPAVELVAIEQTSTGATLIWGGGVYPGTKNGEAWSFSWDTTGTYSDVRSLDEYSYSQSSDETTSVTYNFTFKGNDLTGKAVIDSESTTAYAETDEWSKKLQDQVGATGQIPASSYLSTKKGPARNAGSAADCEDEDCKLSITTTCSGSGEFTGFRTGFDANEATDGILAADQSAGGLE